MSVDWRQGARRVAWAIFLIPVVLLVSYLVFVVNWSFSDGDRVGYLQKFSHKGWLCKSYEGEVGHDDRSRRRADDLVVQRLG